MHPVGPRCTFAVAWAPVGGTSQASSPAEDVCIDHEPVPDDAESQHNGGLGADSGAVGEFGHDERLEWLGFREKEKGRVSRREYTPSLVCTDASKSVLPR